MDHENNRSRISYFAVQNECREMLDRQGEDCNLSEETNLGAGIPQCLFNREDESYMFDETTPAKDFGDLTFHVTDNVSMDKEEGQRNDFLLQVKRRRMLQFQNEEMPSVFLKTKDREDSYEEALADMSQWVSTFSEDSPGYTDLDQSSEGWLADCFSNSEMDYSPTDVSFPEASDVQIDISDFDNNPPEYQPTIDKSGPTPRRRNIVFKGRTAFVQTQPKMVPTVAYPFDIIKPCGYYGDTTLKEINQRLHNSSSSRQKLNSEDLSASNPISAFSGKLVLGKTTIHTEGGRGSITIMKTKG